MPSTDTHRDCHCGQAIDIAVPGHCPRCGRSVESDASTWHTIPDFPPSLLVGV